jgi:phage shock protein A
MKNIVCSCLVAIVVIVVLTSCMSNRRSVRIQHSIDNGDYKSAYINLQELRRRTDKNSQEECRRLLASNRLQLEQGGQEYLRNQFKEWATSSATLDELTQVLQLKLDEYNAFLVVL